MSRINRKAHCLIGEKSLAMPRHLLFFDTETEQEELPNGSIKQNLKLGWACYYRKAYGRHLAKVEWCFFRDALAFWSFVYQHIERKRKLWVIARNIAFDFTVTEGWHYLRQVGFKLKFFHNDASTVIISVKGRFGSIVFLDSMNWFRESLRETGERIGLPKLDIDLDTCTDEELSNYCHRDVEIELENFKQFIRFLEGNKVSRLCYTIGSTAMAAYLFNSYKHKIYIHNDRTAIDLERESYKGGRCECFYLGELNDGNYYTLDVNSLYPAVMRDNPYPVRYIRQVNAMSPTALQDYLKVNSAIAKVLIDTDEPVYAIRRDKTIFPIGCFWTVLTTPELKYALARGHVVEVNRCVFYEQADIFSKHVDKFYALRQDFISAGVDNYSEICKLLLNSLSGKFGQKADVWKKVGECSGEPDRVEICFDSVFHRAKQIRYLLGEIFECVGQEECFNSFPAIIAHVTAYGRLRLYELMKTAGHGNYFYCDTDSLIVNEVGLCNLELEICSKSLGMLKLIETTSNVCIRGLKDYTTSEKTVVKGIKKDAINVRDGVYEQMVWPTFKGLLRSGEADTYIVNKQTKILERKYTKGKVNSDGLVTPLVLDESFLLQSQLY